MSQPSFLSRTTVGWPNYFWIAMGFALFVSLVPRAVHEAMQSNTNRAEDWLPADYDESADLAWFRQYFVGEGFVLLSWDGCTLGDTDKLDQFQEELNKRLETVPTRNLAAARGRPFRPTGKWFRKIISGPSMIEELMEPPLSLSRAEAVRRLEGALVGPPQTDPDGNRLDDDTRTTSLAIHLSAEGHATNRSMRRVLEYLRDTAVNECGIPAEDLHIAGPVVDNVAIDMAGESTLSRLAALSGLIGLAISYWCFRHLPLTLVVVAVGGISAATSMAMVFYFGAAEVLIGGRTVPRYGQMDAVLMSMPALVYVLGLTGAIHLVNYYRDARLKLGLEGSVERAARIAWVPCSLAALTTAVGLGSLFASDIVPIKKFGGFTAISVLATIAILFTLLPVYLHRFPPRWIGRKKWEDMDDSHAGLPPWATACAQWVTRRHALVTVVMIITMIVVAVGTTQLESRISLLKLLDDDSELVQAYTWIEKQMGNLVPMEIVLTVPPEKRRSADEHAEADGKQYRMTMLERLDMVRRMLARIEELDAVSRTLSVATLAPAPSVGGTAAARRAEDFATNTNLEENRKSFADYLQMERTSNGRAGKDNRELWRISARVTALQDIDYGRFTNELREEVEPVLLAYRQRDQLVRLLHESDRRLEGAQLCVLFLGEADEGQPATGSAEELLIDLLRESRVTDRVDGRRGGLVFYNLAQLDSPQMTPDARAQVIEVLRSQDAVLLVSDAGSDHAAPLAADGVNLIDLSDVPVAATSAAQEIALAGQPRPVRAVYTGIIPLVFKTQRELLESLRWSMALATVLIAGVMAVVFRSVLAGMVAMIPNMFPICMVFGTLGWLGVKIDIGIMMTASVALGVAVDNTVHLVTWFRNAQMLGLDRRSAVLMAYERCATAMVQAALIGGLGLVVFSASTFTPTKQFGFLMLTILAAALVGDLVLLPALLCGRLGKYFEPRHRTATQQAHLASDPALAMIADHEDVRAAMGMSPSSTEESAAPGKPDGEGIPPGKPPAAAGSVGGNGASLDARRPMDGEGVSPDHQALREKLRSFRRSSS